MQRLGLASGLIAAQLAFAPAVGAESPSRLRFLDEANIHAKHHGLDEPSGLARAGGGYGLWTVSDDAPRVIGLDPAGRIAGDRSFAVEAGGLEGVEEDAPRLRLLAVDEDAREVLQIDIVDGAVSRHALSGMASWEELAPAFEGAGANDGLEGVTVDPESGRVYIVKERAPRLLIELSASLERILGALVLTAERGFVSDEAPDDRLDVSGLAFDVERRGLWIVSDTGSYVYFYSFLDAQARGWPLTTPGGRLKNAEGVALSFDGATLMIVTDDGKDSRLVRFAVD